MRESTTPPMVRFTQERNGALSCEISRNWIRELFDYENQGSIEHIERLNKRNAAIPPVTDFVEGKAFDFCQVCNHEVYEEDVFCATCGQRLKEGESNE